MILLFAAALAGSAAHASGPNNCIGHTLSECIEAFSAQYTVDDRKLAEAKADQSKRDVNGKPLSDPHAFVIWYGFKGSVNQIEVADIYLGNNGLVRRVELELSPMLKYARTKDDYEATRLLQTMSVFFPSSCWNDDPTVLYRWYENAVKARTHRGQTEHHLSARHAGESRTDSAPASQFCGSRVKVVSVSGYDTDVISTSDTSGYYAGVSLTVGN